ncbi:unnamed protein product, partial [Urochloa humidicola]
AASGRAGDHPSRLYVAPIPSKGETHKLLCERYEQKPQAVQQGRIQETSRS